MKKLSYIMGKENDVSIVDGEIVHSDGKERKAFMRSLFGRLFGCRAEIPAAENKEQIMEHHGEKTGNEAFRGPSTFFLLFLCIVVFFLLFRPSGRMSSFHALEIAKGSRDLSPLMSNEEFIRSYEDASNAAESVGWLVSSVDSGNFLVSYVYLDREGVFKGWFFEVLGKEQIARRITRSMGEYYAGLIDDRFRNSLKVTAERELVTFRVMNAPFASGARTVLEEVALELKRTGVRKEHGWTARRIGREKWLVGFVYEPEGSVGKRELLFGYNSDNGVVYPGAGVWDGASLISQSENQPGEYETSFFPVSVVEEVSEKKTLSLFIQQCSF